MNDEKDDQTGNDEAAADQGADYQVTSDLTEQFKAEAEKFKRDYLYLAAEFENFKKTAIKERTEARKFATERLVVDLLSTLDTLEAALSTPASAETIETIRKGIELTAHELRTSLAKHGVEALPAEGPFDPSIHEALTSEETDSVPDGHIARVFKRPYKLHDRVIRHGQVVVAKTGPKK